jgi:hypothetical protein
LIALISFWFIIFFILLFHHHKIINRSFTLLIIFFLVFIFDFFLKNLPDQIFFKNLHEIVQIGEFGYPLFKTQNMGKSGLETGFVTIHLLFNNFFSYQFTHSLIAASLAYSILYIVKLLVKDNHFSIVSLMVVSCYFINFVFISQRFGLVLILNMLSVYLILNRKYALGLLSSGSAHLFHLSGIILIPLYFLNLIFQKLSNIAIFLISFLILLFIFALLISDVNILNLIPESIFIKTGYFEENQGLSLFYISFFLLYFLFGIHRLKYSEIFSLTSPLNGILFILILVPFYQFGTLAGRLFVLFTIIPFIFSIRNILENLDSRNKKINFIYSIFAFLSFLIYYRVIQNKDYMYWTLIE